MIVTALDVLNMLGNRGHKMFGIGREKSVAEHHMGNAEYIEAFLKRLTSILCL